MAKTALPENEQGEAMVQCEKELRECRRSAKSSNRSMRARVNSPTREQVSKTATAMQTLSWNISKRENQFSQCEKEGESIGDWQIS